MPRATNAARPGQGSSGARGGRNRDRDRDRVTQNLIKQVQQLDAELQQVSLQKPLFTIYNFNRPATLTANQNNYDPGDFDGLWLLSNANRTITGISGGVLHRRLFVYNDNVFGGSTITLAHNSASSSVGNRIFCPSAVDLVLPTRGNAAILLYDTALGGAAGTAGWRVIMS